MAFFCTYQDTFLTVKERRNGPRSKSAEMVRKSEQSLKPYVENLEHRADMLCFLQVPLPPVETPPPEMPETLRVPSVPPALPLVSQGSVGHPEFCRKPCVYVTHGDCSQGAECSFCHMPHQTTKLSKSLRDTLRQLGEAELLALILPHLRAKRIPEADQFLASMERRLTLLPQGTALPHSKLLRFNQCLRNFSFRRLALLSPNVEDTGPALLRLQQQVAR